MTPRDRTIPVARPVFTESAPTPLKTPFLRHVFDGTIAVAIVSAIFAAGIAWNQFQNDGKRLDYHDQEIRELTQLQQQQQQTLAALSQNVADIKDRLPQPRGE